MYTSGCIVWKQLAATLASGGQAILLYVLKSEGSSPGRRGFAMCVLDNEKIHGTIGGGIMEHKLVELARSMIGSPTNQVLIKEQHHSKDHPTNQSGMICSGTQYVALIPLDSNDLAAMQQLVKACSGHQPVRLTLGDSGLSVSTDISEGGSFNFESPTQWYYEELVGIRPRVHIVGAGHVGLALSELLASLGFYVIIYDNRSQLNTLAQNTFAHEKHLVDYGEIGKEIPADETAYVVIMTFGYRTDKVVLEQLMDRPFRYIGMLGSDEKIAQMKAAFTAAGISPDRYDHVHTPIGLPVYSKTAGEIAVSVAAEIIREKNKDLPTGRSIPNL